MLKLRSSTTSPFGRKIKVAALFTGQPLEVLPSDTMDPNDPLRRDNPLGKIPTLILDDGTTVYDSRVIAEYLDFDAGGGKIIPAQWPARLHVLKLQALADGIVDAAILQLYEGRFRPTEKHEPAWIAHQAGKVERGLETLEANPPKATKTPDIGVISCACALDWLAFRFPMMMKDKYPKLHAFLAEFAALHPEFEKTAPRI
jgi:glutathione S-transferase